MRALCIVHGWLPSGALHPLVLERLSPAWLARFRKQSCAPYAHDLVTLAAQIAACPPAALLAARLPDEALTGFRQAWVAMPYAARLVRAEAYPQAGVHWPETVLDETARLLSSALAEEGVRVLRVGGAFLVLLQSPLEAAPPSWGEVCASGIPARHPEGADGHALARLLVMMQMVLRATKRPDLPHGLWCWGACPLPAPLVPLLRAYVRDATLACVVEQRDARCALLAPEHVPLLWPRKMPEHVLLLGPAGSLWLSRSRWPWHARKLPSPEPSEDMRWLSLLQALIVQGAGQAQPTLPASAR